MGGTHLVFFFQAEDGIRYSSVTGVQTYALPIYTWQDDRAWFPSLLCWSHEGGWDQPGLAGSRPGALARWRFTGGTLLTLICGVGLHLPYFVHRLLLSFLVYAALVLVLFLYGHEGLAPLHEEGDDTICSLDRRLLVVAADLRHKACEFAQRFATEFHDRIQVGTRLLVKPERDGRVPPAAGLQEHQLHGCLLGIVLEQGESEAQAHSERG